MPAHLPVQLKNVDSCLIGCIGKKDSIFEAKSPSEQQHGVCVVKLHVSFIQINKHLWNSDQAPM